MPTIKNLMGQVFGKLTVIDGPDSRPYGDKKATRVYWKAECSCGLTEPKWYSRSSLLNSIHKSCGCIKVDNFYEVIYDPDGSYILVELTRNQWGTCDVNDWFNTLINYKWSAWYCKESSTYYCKTNHDIKMHRLVLGITDRNVHVDHKNRNPLENRRFNLRVAIGAQNAQNSGYRKHNTSGYIGISFKKENKKWSASINYEGKQIHIGYSKDAKELAAKRDLAALYLHKEFAVLNFPEQIEEYRETLKLGKPF